MNDSTPGDSVFLAARFNFIREFSAEDRLFKPVSFPGASCRCLRMPWGVHPMAQCRLLNYSQRMNEQHYFQSQRTQDSAHLGSIHVHAPVRTPNNNQRHAAVKPSHDRSEEHTSELQSLRHLVCRL